MFQGVRDSVRRAAQVGGVVAAAACLALSAPAVATAGAAFPFADNNNNGVYDAGDVDITGEVMAGYFATPNSIVIPADARALTTKSLKGFKLVAGKDVVVQANLAVSTDGGITLVANGGSVVVSDRKTLRAGFLRVQAQADVMIGKMAQLEAKGGPVAGSGHVTMESIGGDIRFLAGSRLTARDDVQLVAWAGGVEFDYGVQASSSLGIVSVHAEGEVSIDGSKVRAKSLSIYSGSDMVSFQNNTVRVTDADGWVSIVAAGTGTGGRDGLGSMIDATGSRWQDVAADNMLFSADQVVGH
jgi:hypothetical protein